MKNLSPEQVKIYGYAVLINKFEPTFRSFLANEILTLNYGVDWLNGVPSGVVTEVKAKSEKQTFEDPLSFLDETDFPHLKEIAIYKDNFKSVSRFCGNITKDKFIEYMDQLIDARNKIAHAYRYFSSFDFEEMLDNLNKIIGGTLAEEVRAYIKNGVYNGIREIPPDIIKNRENSTSVDNLPDEDYDLEGGFVGRKVEKTKLIELLYSNLDRIITINGSGGIGKTAFALNVAYSIKDDAKNAFDAIVWFSAKTSRLSSEGIVSVEPQFKNIEQLTKGILNVLTSKNDLVELAEEDKLKKYVYDMLSNQKVLLIIDNIESVLNDQSLIDFIKNVPVPTKVLITSRRGLGEIERRFPLKELPDKDAILLFRLICKDKDLNTLVNLDDNTILKFVKQVQNYPLAIKWCLAQTYKGRDVEEAFKAPKKGGSDISHFCFDQTFNMLSKDAKRCLYAISIFEKENPTLVTLEQLTGFSSDVSESAILELVNTSFVFPTHEKNGDRVITRYSIIGPTQDFVKLELESDSTTKTDLNSRLHKLKTTIESKDKRRSGYSQGFSEQRTYTIDEQIAESKIIKAWKEDRINNYKKADDLFKEAVNQVPNVSFALIAYAKFKAKHRYYEEANNLLSAGSKIDPNDYHVWFTWGGICRKADDLIKAEEYLIKAKKLNQNPAVLTELGRTYCFEGKYESADTCFNESLMHPTAYTNNKHRSITLMYMADNFRRWSEGFFLRKDYEDGFGKLDKAISAIEKSINVDKYSKQPYSVKAQIFLDYGINSLHHKDFEKATKYLEKSIATNDIYNGNIKTSIDAPRDIKTAAYYYMARLLIEKTSPNIKKNDLEHLVRKALACAKPNSDYIPKLNSLLGLEREKGIIKYYDYDKKFGLISSKGITYSFLRRNCRFRIEDMDNFGSNKEVSFLVKDHPKDKNKKIADDVSLL